MRIKPHLNGALLYVCQISLTSRFQPKPSHFVSLHDTFRFCDYSLDPIFSNGYSDLTAMPREFANRYLNPGDERRTNVPVIASTRQNNDISNLYVAYSAYNYSDVRVAKGDFIRMKEISLSYDFPQSVSSKLRMSGLSLKFQATNPFLIYSDKKLQGQDPEFFNTGGVAVPMPKQFTLTLRVSF